MNKVKTIDVNAKEWFDKLNGNSYFAARVVVNYGTNTARSYVLPFQYGCRSHLYYAFELLKEKKEINYFGNPTIWTRDKGIILRYSKEEGCRKRDVKNFGSISDSW